MGYRHDRHDLIQAGIAVVLEDGVGALTFGRVAKVLGISDRMVVYYFASKEVLVTEVVAVMGLEMQSLLEKAFGDSMTSEEMMRVAWPVLSNSKVDSLMAVFFEVVGLASARKQPFVTLSAGLIESWVDWITDRVEGESVALRRKSALSIVARIDGLLMIRQVCGPRAANDAARAMGIVD